jgi:hypothetical protein
MELLKRVLTNGVLTKLTQFSSGPIFEDLKDMIHNLKILLDLNIIDYSSKHLYLYFSP